MFQIVRAHEDGLLQRLCQTVQQEHHGDFAWVVKIGGRFVQQDDGCLLCNRLRNHHLLPFTVRERLHLSGSQFLDAHPSEAFLHHHLVLLAQFAPESCIGTSSHRHHLLGSHVLDVRIVRQHHTHQLCQLLALILFDASSHHLHLTAQCRLESRQCAQQCRFARSVRSQQTSHLPAVQLCVQS